MKKLLIILMVMGFLLIFVNGCSDKKEMTMEKYIEEGDVSSLKKILSENPSLSNQKTFIGLAPLEYASGYSKNRKDIIKLLIRYGANVNSKNEYNSTPLHSMAFHADAGIIEFLIINGASINKINNFGKTPLDMAYDSQKAMFARRNDSAVKYTKL